MKYFNGFPADNGATDWMDSPRLAAILALCKSEKAINMEIYILKSCFCPIRCPGMHEVLWDFSRDQLVPFLAGLKVQNNIEWTRYLYARARENYFRAANGDILWAPSVINHIRICAGLRPFLIGKVWLMLDMLYQSIASRYMKHVEPNQLICMCVTAGPAYVKLYKKIVRDWKYLVVNYWCGWRNESEVAELIINKLESYGD